MKLKNIGILDKRMGLKEQKTIIDMINGEIGYIESFEKPIFTCKFYNLGMSPNAKVTLVRKAPFGGAYYVKINKTLVALRTIEAKSIIIKK